MGKETYQIKDYFHYEVVAFAGAMNPKGKLGCNKNQMYSTDHYSILVVVKNGLFSVFTMMMYTLPVSSSL